MTVLAIICFLSIWSQSAQPSEPVAVGEFPSKPVWIFEAGGPVVASPVVKEGTVFIKTRHLLYALKATTGEELWRADSESGAGIGIAPVVAGEAVIVPEEYSGLAAFSTANGELLWRVPPLDDSRTNSVTGSIQSMASNTDRLYVARFDWSLVAYDLKNGEIVWQLHTPSRSFPSLAADENRIFRAAGSELNQYDAKTGEILSHTDSEVFLPQIVLEDKTLYISDTQNNIVHAVDTSSAGSNVLWSAELPRDLDTFELNCLAIQGNVIYVAADRLFALSKEDGHSLWTTAETGRLECPVFIGDQIYVRNTGNDLYAFDQGTGFETGRLSVRENTVMKHKPMRSPAVAGDLLIVPFGDNRIFAYQP
jgi:outer membrane protein assembly factor BamB